ncbi:hypothetical protein Gohar_017330 [Gossypium harknessii]|uniref:Uncharacterized protein n=1 Tax=Gossypium harknessii TaxID=34285 RepID=A0A7J9G5I4_9ROSI|nr:hypothetical protein [Gossypium harknessii]
MYDEFGNLKKKFRAKTQQAEAARVLPGSGRAGWEVEELGIRLCRELNCAGFCLLRHPTRCLWSVNPLPIQALKPSTKVGDKIPTGNNTRLVDVPLGL